MVEQNALMFNGRIAYDRTYSGLALDAEEGDRVAATMGDCSVLLMASHGVTVVGPSVAMAFNDLYYLERAATFQVLARSSGNRLRAIAPEVIDKTSGQIVDELPKLAERHFTALKRILDREEPEYRN